MKVLEDAVNYIRQRKEMFLRLQEPNPIELVEHIVSDAMYSGASECYILREDNWWLIASKTDWLKCQSKHSPEALFTQIVAFPEAGQNSMRGEILLTAFAKKVITATPNERTVISGNVADDECVWRMALRNPEWQRVIAFRF
jgi:hypothetical protein